jgi:Tfp pilus assembly protein PilF
MRYRIVLLLLPWIALAQLPGGDPIQSLVNQYQRASQAGHSAEAAARRADARDLLSRISPKAPQFSFWVQQVAELYGNVGRTEEARAILEDGLARGGDDPNLLESLSRTWEQDGNLLQAIAPAERALAAAESEPELADLTIFSFRLPSSMPLAQFYQCLAHLYQSVGRKQEAEGVAARFAARAKHDWTLGSMYQDLGETEKAASVYRAEADRAEPADRAGILNRLAGLYERNGQYAEAAAATEEASGPPCCTRAAARLWAKAGQRDKAEQIYESLLSSPDASYDVWADYARFLTAGGQGGQAESLLQGYLDAHPSLDGGEKAQILIALGNALGRDREQTYLAQVPAALSHDQPAPPPDLFSQAREAFNSADFGAAVSLGLQALNRNPAETLRAMWLVGELESNQRPVEAGQLYSAILAAAQASAPDRPDPLLQVLKERADSLIRLRRWPEAEETSTSTAPPRSRRTAASRAPSPIVSAWNSASHCAPIPRPSWRSRNLSPARPAPNTPTRSATSKSCPRRNKEVRVGRIAPARTGQRGGLPPVVGGVARGEALPLFRQIVERENGGNRTDGNARAAIDAFHRIDVEQLLVGVGRLVLLRVNAVDRAGVDAGGVFRPNTGLSDYVCHCSIYPGPYR